LFLDELPEFDRRVLELLREPLESGVIHISRAARQVEYPARFQLVAAMNPCKCGWLGDPSGRCHCTIEQVRSYRARVSGPLLDRIDMHVEVPPVPMQVLRRIDRAGQTSSAVRERVTQARERQVQRQGTLNAYLQGATLERHGRLEETSEALLEKVMQKFDLSARSYHRIVRLARTIADLANADHIDTPHVSEAVGYRVLDRSL
jgi:magnesium chelatase family protein